MIVLPGWNSTRAVRVAAALAAVVGLVLIRPVPVLLGDGLEYAAVVNAWINHGSPDIRAEDIRTLPALFEQEGYSGLHPNTVAVTRDGKTYSVHFWLYSLACAPTALLLRTFGANPLMAFPTTNAMFFMALVAAAAWSTRLTRRDRVLIALAAVSPVIRYIPLAHPEAFTWACVLASLLAGNHERYGLAAACASAGAMQNPPVAGLALYWVIIAASERRWRGAVVAAAGASLALLPPIFSWLTLGNLNPVAARGFLDLGWAIADRAFGLLIDFDQGLLAYVPGLLLLAAASAWRTRHLRHLGMFAVFFFMLFGAATNIGANSPFPGLMRYAVWMMPALAWLATETIGQTAQARLALRLVLLVHAALLAPTPPAPHKHGRLSTYALSHWPAWYRPAPGAFADRVTDLDLAVLRRMAIGFVRDDGTVTKLLVEPENVPRLDRVFVVDPAYFNRVSAQASHRSGLYYLNPPDGAVRSLCGPGVASAAEFRHAVRAQVAETPATTDGRQLMVWLDLANHGDQALCNLGSGSRIAFNLTTRFRQDGRMTREGPRTRGPQVLRPGESERQAMVIGLPAQIGRYDIDVLPVLETVGHGEVGGTLAVEVVSPEPAYHATVALR